jgi:predicted nicotinamide N-methyase
MTTPDQSKIDSHIQIILDRYADRENIKILNTPPSYLLSHYLSNVLQPEELHGKTILEIGAGGSQYIPVFLDAGCEEYYANDIIPERLAASRVKDARYHELPGDFRHIDLPEPVDIVFANLTMMFLQPCWMSLCR